MATDLLFYARDLKFNFMTKKQKKCIFFSGKNAGKNDDKMKSMEKAFCYWLWLCS